MKPYSAHLDLLNRIKQETSDELLKNHQLYCEVGDWLNSAVLKLQKKEWSDGGIDQGVFFSIWVGEVEAKKEYFHYNIHALKLRLWKGYSIQSREFASAFRARLNEHGGQWPNLRTDYGPQTLMQGWQSANLSELRTEILKIIDHFVDIHEIIDGLLEERKCAAV